MTNIPSGQDDSRNDADGQPELTEDDEEPKSRIKDIGGRASWSGEEDREDREDEEQEESGTMVPYMPLQRLSQTRRIDLQNARSLKNKSHPGLMARAHVNREIMSKINTICIKCLRNVAVWTTIEIMETKF